ncbi:MAG: hypothetical protein ACHQ15_08130, partial [Candidatus Limnocylindrales bacterium]
MHRVLAGDPQLGRRPQDHRLGSVTRCPGTARDHRMARYRFSGGSARDRIGRWRRADGPDPAARCGRQGADSVADVPVGARSSGRATAPAPFDLAHEIGLAPAHELLLRVPVVHGPTVPIHVSVPAGEVAPREAAPLNDPFAATVVQAPVPP